MAEEAAEAATVVRSFSRSVPFIPRKSSIDFSYFRRTRSNAVAAAKFATSAAQLPHRRCARWFGVRSALTAIVIS